MVETTKVYDNDISLRYRRQDKQIKETKPQIVKEDTKEFTSSKSVGESKLDLSSSASIKSNFAKRQASRNNLIQSAKEIGDTRLVKILEDEEVHETLQLKENLFRAEANKLIFESVDRDLRRQQLDRKYDDEFLTVSEIEEYY